MKERARTEKSKFLSYVLRHRPDAIGITLDDQGWTPVVTLLEACAKRGKAISKSDLKEIVETNAKKRFAFSEDGQRIRANQGHSVAVDLAYAPATPPAELYHGTVEKFLPDILKDGLKRMARHHVHLSPDIATATNVGGRRGKPVILRVDAKRMYEDGHVFFVSENSVWLTEHVPVEYVSVERT